jgi:hypothetical protein
MLPHEAQHALAADGEPAMRQAGADLAIPLAMKGRRRQHRADGGHELGVAGHRLRPALVQADGQARRGRHRIDRRPGDPEDGTDHRERIPLARAGADHRPLEILVCNAPFFLTRSRIRCATS